MWKSDHINSIYVSLSSIHMRTEIPYHFLILFPLSWLANSLDHEPYNSLHRVGTTIVARTPFNTIDLRKHVVEGYFRLSSTTSPEDGV